MLLKYSDLSHRNVIQLCQNKMSLRCNSQLGCFCVYALLRISAIQDYSSYIDSKMLIV